MNKKTKDKLKEVFAWGVDNHSEEFCVNFQFTGHVDWFEYEIETKMQNFGSSIHYMKLDEDSFDELNELLKDFESFKSEFDKWNTPENIKQRDDEEKEEEILSLKKRLKALEENK